MKELNRDELLKVLGGEDIVEPDETEIIYGRATSYGSYY
jgi:hypothetical protein